MHWWSKSALAEVSVAAQIFPEKARKAVRAFAKNFYGHTYYLSPQEDTLIMFLRDQGVLMIMLRIPMFSPIQRQFQNINTVRLYNKNNMLPWRCWIRTRQAKPFSTLTLLKEIELKVIGHIYLLIYALLQTLASSLALDLYCLPTRTRKI